MTEYHQRTANQIYVQSKAEEEEMGCDSAAVDRFENYCLNYLNKCDLFSV